MKTAPRGVSNAPLLVAAACFFVGLAVGFILGRFDSSDPTPPPGDNAPNTLIGRATPLGSTSISGTGASPKGAAPATNPLAPPPADPDELLATLKKRLTAIKGSGNPMRHLLELAPLVLALEEGQLPEVLKMTEGNRDMFFKAMLTSTLFMRWTELNPNAAISAAEGITDAQVKSMALQGALMGWSESDPDAAWNYVINGKTGPEQTQMISGLMTGMAMSDPKKAAAYAAKIENPMARNQAYTMLSYSWASSDPDAALAWANSLEDEALRRKIQPGILSSLAQIAVGTAVAGGPPHRSVREELPHTAPPLGMTVKMAPISTLP